MRLLESYNDFDFSAKKHIKTDILMDVLKDFEDEYNDIKISELPVKKTTPGHWKIIDPNGCIQIERGNILITKSELDNKIQRALEYYYQETGQKIYIKIMMGDYLGFKESDFFHKPYPRFRKAQILLLLYNNPVDFNDTGYKTFSLI